jgi:hypothetical protein
MNDAHVAALLYRVEHSPFLNYEQPYEHDLPECRIRMERGEATVEPKVHFATVEEARAIVEARLGAWELDVALKNDDPGVLRFHYLRPVDRNPTPGVAHLRGFRITIELGKLVHHVGLAAPPVGLAVRPGSDVEAMFDEWCDYKAGRANLGHTANFCLTALKKKGGASKASKKFGISGAVLRHLGHLAATKGGRAHSRKWNGWASEYTESEHAWLEAVLKILIRRAAEVADDPNAARACITMDHPDLPRLRL